MKSDPTSLDKTVPPPAFSRTKASYSSQLADNTHRDSVELDMALLLNRLPQLRRISISSQPTGNVVPPAAKTLKNNSKARSFRHVSRKSLSKLVQGRYYASESKGKNESSNVAEEVTSDTIPPPNMTTYPKAMQAVENPISPSEAMDEIQIGPDGVVVPPKRPGAVASAEFVARKASSSQQDLLKRMYAIDKKLQTGKKDKTDDLGTSTPKKRAASYKAPEMVVFDYHPRRWVSTLNGVTCLASVREKKLVFMIASSPSPPLHFPCLLTFYSCNLNLYSSLSMLGASSLSPHTL